MENTSFKDQVTIDAFKNLDAFKAAFFIIGISLVAFAFLVWLIYFKGGSESYADWVRYLPAVNASLNSLSTIFLVLAIRAIYRKEYSLHMKLNLAAFGTSTAFLLTYVIYHNAVGHTSFTGEGLIRPIYFTILISHILLSALVVPLILFSFYLAFAGKFKQHRAVSKVTFPVWLYVSVTGVLIFLILNTFSKAG
jgi:putative membrane protein